MLYKIAELIYIIIDVIKAKGGINMGRAKQP